MPTSLRLRSLRLVTTATGLMLCLPALADEFRSAWQHAPDGVWTGAEYYANRLQDWRVQDGRVECVEAAANKPMRVMHVLPVELVPQRGELEVRVRLGRIAADKPGNEAAFAGFLVGAGGPDVDYRLTALCHHRPAKDGGLAAGVDHGGRVAFRDNETNRSPNNQWTVDGGLAKGEFDEIRATRTKGTVSSSDVRDVELVLRAAPAGEGYTLTLSAHTPDGDLLSEAVLENVEPRLVDGDVGLVSHLGAGGTGHWFSDLHISGDKAKVHPDRTFGPILCTQYTLSRGVLKLTAQAAPLPAGRAALQVQRAGGWKTVAEAELIPDSHTFPFRVEGWSETRDVPFWVECQTMDREGADARAYYSGIIRAIPERDPFVLAAFTGNKQFTGALQWNHDGVWFPPMDIVSAVRFHNPDFLFFSGDQIYEGDLTGAQRTPLEKAMLDYHDKYRRWCWAFGELTRDRPSVAIPDDHDVFHGNVWGAGGRHAKRQDDGGYTMPAEFVKMVERTQTSHLPDPVDPAPVEQGIGVYFTRVEYAGVSFAVLEDRKFKSAPGPLLPDGKVVNGWFRNPEFDPATESDVPGAVLLGERQLRFLRDWATDWSDGAWMKVTLSQTIFANVATLPADTGEPALPSAPILPRDGYPENYVLAADADSNGWPQSGRNRALREIRRAFAIHIAGDQHLSSFIRYGVDEWDDAGYAFCVPAIANTWPRRWFPPTPGEGWVDGQLRYTGRYRDGFGNLMTVLAAGNPFETHKQPEGLHDRAPGYGIIRFDRRTRDIVVECWPRYSDPSKPGAEQYRGWPITVNQLDNYARKPAGYLPPLEIEGMETPVIRVTNEASGEVEYALRLREPRFRPPVFANGAYTIEVGEPGTPRMKRVEGMRATADQAPVRVRVPG